jgi:hypothetical protein
MGNLAEVRRLIDAATELLIHATDLIDGDPELEESDPAEDDNPAEDDDPAEDGGDEEDDGTAEPEEGI